jgi:tripartite ATP-independent transporter DctM subunit
MKLRLPKSRSNWKTQRFSAMELWILFGIFTLLMLIGTPIAFCLGVASFATVLYMGLPPLVVFQRLNSGMSVFSLLAIPFFIYAGDLMVRGGIASRIVAFAGSLVGHVRGGLGQVNIATATLFGGISGSAVAEAAAVGGLMIPQMKARGYGADYAVNITSMAALIALLIPPSHNMIIYSISAGGKISIADLFTAGILPGLLLALSLMVTAYVVARQRGYPTEPFPGFKAVAHLAAVAVPGLLLIAIIFGGVRSGVFTATESSCIAVIYALLVTVFIYRQMSWEDFVHATMGAVRTTAMVLLIIGTAAAFSWLMAFLKVPAALVAWMNTVSDNPLIVLLLLNVLMLLLGTFMDMGPTIIITTPIFLPVVQAYDVDPVHFGVIMILNYGIGLNTPPVGAVQFVACAVGKITVWEAMRSIWPFYGAGLVVLGLVTYIPALSLWLPGVFK